MAVLGVELWQAILLGIVQGIAEFLPISSSGHLVIMGDLLARWSGTPGGLEEPLALTVALHAGTLVSILWVYRRELRRLMNLNLLMLIVLATIPVAVVGVLFKDTIEGIFESPLLAGCALLVTSLLLWFGQRFERGIYSFQQITPLQAVLIGCWQAFALLPGISRSGSTIAGGLLSGLDRQAAATFSFFIAIPAIGGGSGYLLLKLWKSPQQIDWVPLGLGAITACVVGIVSLEILLRLITRQKLHWFAYYCAIVGGATIAAYLLPA